MNRITPNNISFRMMIFFLLVFTMLTLIVAPLLGGSISNLTKDLREMEAKVITETLEECDGNKTEAANKLNITLRQLRYRIEKFGL